MEASETSVYFFTTNNAKPDITAIFLLSNHRLRIKILAATCDFQQCDILTSVYSQTSMCSLHLSLNIKMMFGQKLDSHRIFKRLTKALTRLHVCTGWSELLLVAYTTLLEISCHGSIIFSIFLLIFCHWAEQNQPSQPSYASVQ